MNSALSSQQELSKIEVALGQRVFEAQLARDLQCVEEALLHVVQSDIGLLSQAGQYVLRSGGKRLRPRVLLVAHQAMGATDASIAVRAAAAIELLHTASLVHDDINDRSDLRRGQASVNRRWGDNLALLIGDFIFVRLLKVMSGLQGRAFDILADCCTAVVEGETMQMLHAGNRNVTEAEYLAAVSRKTASLFAACAEMGGVLAEPPACHNEAHLAALRTYGECLGMAFQIRDDMLDLIGKRSEMGKPIANDVAQGKVSLATLYAMQHSSQAASLLWSQQPDPQRLLTIVQETGALDYAAGKAQEYASRAVQALSLVSESPAKAELVRLADYALSRER